MPTEPAQAAPVAHRALVTALMLAVAAVGATIFAISPLLPDIAHAFDVPVARAGVLPGAFGISLAIVAPLIGLTAQRLPRALLIIWGLVVFALAWLAALVATSFATLMLLAALAGAATGAVLPATYAYAADLSSYAQRARVMGRIVSGWSIAILVVVPTMALAAQVVDWRWAFGALAACAIGIALLLAFTPRPAAPTIAALDGAALLASLSRVFRDRPTRLLLAANMLDMGAFYAVYSYAGAELRRLNDWGSSMAGLTVATYGLGLAIVTFNGQLIDRWGKRRSAIGALLALGAVLSALPWLAAVPLAMAAGIVLWGVVQGGFFTAITTLATEQIPELRGVVVALLSASTYLGVSLYTPLSALIYERAGYWAVGLEAACGCLLAAALLSRLPVESEPAQL
jgi:predicted MFS family arabinose efflux permease